MGLRVYNTLTGQKEIFEPVEEGEVSMYVCGPTVYDSCHIGHARSVIFFDIVYRYLKLIGYDVTYVRNFTDVDDKIIKKSNETGLTCEEVSEKYIEEFYRDMDALKVKRATIEPRATNYIKEIIEVIEILIDKGMAYPVDGDVYYAIESFEKYGILSGRKLEDMEAGARIEVDERKKSPHDFALWKSEKPGEPSWESPWGKGRPGWHIECSAMSWKLLGESFDIHGGGKDLIFPHHENEIAQSAGAFGTDFVKYWLHNGFVNINSEKMSKSLGNTTMIKDMLEAFHPEAIRLFLLSSHYRSPIDFTDQSMKEATGNLDKIYAVMQRMAERFENLPMIRLNANNKAKMGPAFKEFGRALEDDFNTAKALAVLFDSIRNLNRKLDQELADDDYDGRFAIEWLASDIVRMTNLLGLFSEIPDEYFENKRLQAAGETGLDPETIEKMINARTEARKAKDFQEADRIRDELESMNVAIEDKPDGTIWKYIES